MRFVIDFDKNGWWSFEPLYGAFAHETFWEEGIGILELIHVPLGGKFDEKC